MTAHHVDAQGVNPEAFCQQGDDSLVGQALLGRLLTAVENGGAGTVSRRSKMAAHNRAVKDSPVNGTSAPVFRLMSDS